MADDNTSMEVANTGEMEVKQQELTIIEQLTRGEVDMQVATARRFPRSIQAFNQAATAMAGKTPAVAASCFYVIPRAGKKIEGPSIRLAEIVGACWGNLRAESRVIAAGEKTVCAQATAWDIQTNFLVRQETTRLIVDRSGRRYSDDMIVVTGNAACSIALRNAIFRVVPRAYVDEIYEHCKRVAAGDRGSLDQARADWMKWFAARGINQEQVLELLGRPGLPDITLEDITTFNGLSTALAEGTTTLEQVFGTPEQRKEAATHKFGFKARQEAKQAEPQAEAKAETAPIADDEPPMRPPPARRPAANGRGSGDQSK